MKTVQLYKGLPGSGKSTLARLTLEHNPGAYKRVNKDDLRAMLDDGKWSGDNEKFVLKLRDHIILSALEAGKHVIVDDTNLHPKHEKQIRELIKDKAQLQVIDLTDVPIEECIKRDLKRPKSVGEKVIRDMARRFLSDAKATLHLEQDESLPPAIICDLDGTLALLNGRNPYDASKCDLDLVNEAVLDVVNGFEVSTGGTIIFVTGREDKFIEPTMRFLNDNVGEGIDWVLLMRKSGDSRKDSIVKKEIFDENIRNKYYVRYVLDDRNQVVNMWRNEIGLPCFQVAEGDF